MTNFDYPQETAPVVRVSAFGTDAIEVPFVEGKDVRYYLEQAKLLPGFMSRSRKAYTLNGESVNLDTRLLSEASIVVTNKVRNG